jgi:hypothetical protein
MNAGTTLRLVRFALILASAYCTAGAEQRINLIDHPTVAEIESGLTAWAQSYPQRIKVETVGRTLEGRPILLAIITDFSAPDTDKAIVLLSATHAGDELNAATSLLHLSRWLVSNDREAARIRHGIITLVMPCMCPDGYDKSPPSKRNSKGINVYNSWNWDGPKDLPNNPEGYALAQVVDKYRPDAAIDVHGLGVRGMGMWESTAFSWGDFLAQGYDSALSEEMDRAAEMAGFLIVRPARDTGRIKVNAPIEGLGHHFYYVRNDITVASYLYNKYHTLAINCEVAYEASAVARIRKMLELGLDTWRGEFFPGYPVNSVGGWGSMALTAWGDTAVKRRRSRVELWRNTDRILSSLAFAQPANEKLMAVCATNTEAAKRWIGDGEMESFVAGLAKYPGIDEEYIARFVEGTVMNKVIGPREVHYTQGYKHSSTLNEPLRFGLAVRLLIPYLDAKIVDARINGLPVAESAIDGYLVRHGPGTVVQFNIPPEKVGQLHVFTCKYSSETKRRQGFNAEDWK